MKITIYGWSTRSLLKLADPDWLVAQAMMR
jgi:hypothetical protein